MPTFLMITGAILLLVAFIAIPKMEVPQYGILFGGIGATFVLGAFTSGGVFAIGLCIMFFGLIVTLAVAFFTEKSRRNSIVAATLAGLLAVGTILVLPSLTTTTSRALSETPIVSGTPGAAILAGSQAVTADAPVTIECSNESLKTYIDLRNCVDELSQSDANAYKSYMDRAPELPSWNEVLQYADLQEKTGADLRVITIFNANMSDAEARNAVRQDIGASADALPIVNAGSGSLVNTRGVTTGSFEEFRDNRSQVRVMLVPPMETTTTASFTLAAGSKPMADISYAQKGVGVLTECKNPSRGIVVHVPATPDTTQTPPASHNPPSSTTPPGHNPPPVVPPTTPDNPKCEGKDCSPTTPPPGKCKENCNEEPPPNTCEENPSKCEEEPPPSCEGKDCTPSCTDNCTPPPGGCKEKCEEEPPPPNTCEENPSKCEEDEGKDPSHGPKQPEHHEPVDAPDSNQGESTPPAEDDPADPDTAPDAGSPNAGETDAPGVDEPTEDNQHEVPADRDDDVAPVEDDPATGEVDGSDSPFGGNTNESQESNSTEQQDTTSGSSQEADTTSDSDTVSSNNDSPSSNQGESEPPTVEVELASMSTDNGGTMMDFAIVLSLGITLGAAFVLRYRVRQS